MNGRRFRLIWRAGGKTYCMEVGGVEHARGIIKKIPVTEAVVQGYESGRWVHHETLVVTLENFAKGAAQWLNSNNSKRM